MKMLPKLLHRVTAVPVKIPADLFAKIDKPIKFIQKCKLVKFTWKIQKPKQY